VTHSPLATPSATRAVLKHHGLAAKKSLGQHFLVDDNIVGRILALADLAGNEVVLEVGPGIGTLTSALCQRVGAVVAVERDRELLPVLADTTRDCARLRIVQADAVVVETSSLSEPYGPPEALVANLPYAVAATVVLRFLEDLPTLRQATVMVQSEVADRMSAAPGSKEYGSYTVKLRMLARPDGRFQVPRSCFLPQPRVDSAVLRLVRDPLIADEKLLRSAARAADASFAQRRKMIRNSLGGSLGLPSRDVDRLLAAAGIAADSRAEQLPVEAFIALGAALVDLSL
jgi:16S rRNA (adenine1518-N6/adenine1519-N6)-dimethyltransferase